MKSEKTTELEPTIRECFESDPELISTFHIYSGQPLDNCVKKTVCDLQNAESTFEFYHLKDGPKLVGFFGSERGNYLSTIFIHPAYRAKEKIGQVWKLIASHFPEEFFTAVYSKNSRAVKFFTRNGQVVDRSTANGHPITVFKLGNH